MNMKVYKSDASDKTVSTFHIVMGYKELFHAVRALHIQTFPSL